MWSTTKHFSYIYIIYSSVIMLYAIFNHKNIVIYTIKFFGIPRHGQTKISAASHSHRQRAIMNSTTHIYIDECVEITKSFSFIHLLYIQIIYKKRIYKCVYFTLINWLDHFATFIRISKFICCVYLKLCSAFDLLS